MVVSAVAVVSALAAALLVGAWFGVACLALALTLAFPAVSILIDLIDLRHRTCAGQMENLKWESELD